jgi:formamidopyrimidine-DNA glycosylase
MPELPEVETVVRTLRPRLVGRTFGVVRHLRADIVEPKGTDLAALIAGRCVRAIDRRGKRIILVLDDGNRFYIHLGMTGRLTVEAASAAVQPHTHLLVEIADGDSQLRFRDPRRFGGIWWLGINGVGDERMGPEPLEVRAAQLAQRLAKTRRAIKSALLDQRLIAGLGNIYVDESLFRARIHPLTRADRLKLRQVQALTRAIKLVLRNAIRHRGSTLRDYRDAEGARGGFQLRHQVYDRKGKPCTACGKPIQRTVLGGRSTHFCRKCQKKS